MDRWLCPSPLGAEVQVSTRPAKDAYPPLHCPTQLALSLLAFRPSPLHWYMAWNGVTPIVKDRVHYLSNQVVMNKCFLLNPEKNLAEVCLVVFENNALLILKNDVTEPKARPLLITR